MSWSVNCIGSPAKVKAALEKQFAQAKENTKSMPHENATVGLVEQAVNAELDFLSQFEGMAVKVDGSGSAYISADKKNGSSQMSVSVVPLYGFVG